MRGCPKSKGQPPYAKGGNMIQLGNEKTSIQGIQPKPSNVATTEIGRTDTRGASGKGSKWNDRAARYGAPQKAIQGRGYKCLSSKNAVEGNRLRIHTAGIFITKDSQRVERKCKLHVVERYVTARPQDDQSVSRGSDEGSDRRSVLRDRRTTAR